MPCIFVKCIVVYVWLCAVRVQRGGGARGSKRSVFCKPDFSFAVEVRDEFMLASGDDGGSGGGGVDIVDGDGGKLDEVLGKKMPYESEQNIYVVWQLM